MNPTITRILVGALALAASVATAADFHVASNGHDANPGSLERPWKSLEAVSGRAFAPGDTVRFARGTSYSGCIEITASGTSDKPIVFTSLGDGPAPRLNNPRFADHNGRIIEITGSHIVVENLYFHDTPTPPPDKPPVEWPQSAQHRSVPEMGAVSIAKEAAHVVVQNCEFSNCPIGIRVRGRHSIVRGNWLHDAGKITEQWGAIAVAVVGPHNEIAYNLVENYGFYGGAFGLDGAAVELDGEDRGFFDAHDTHIHHNVSRNTKGGFLEITGRTRDVTVEYNVSDDVDKFVGVVGIKSLRIVNNTIIRTRNPEVAPRTFWTFNTQNDDEISIASNVFYLGRGQLVYRSERHPQGFLNTKRRNNLYYSPDGDIAAMIGGSLAVDESTGDPQFVNAAVGDYTPKPGSLASKSKMGAHPSGAPSWKAGIHHEPSHYPHPCGAKR
jgi:hypothetical protein